MLKEQIKIYGQTETAVRETIKICCDRNILKEYLESQEKEIVDIMMTLFDDEIALKNSFASAERRAERRGEEKGQRNTAGLMSYLASHGRSDDIIKAGSDEAYLNQLLNDFNSGVLTAN